MLWRANRTREKALRLHYSSKLIEQNRLTYVVIGQADSATIYPQVSKSSYESGQVLESSFSIEYKGDATNAVLDWPFVFTI